MTELGRGTLELPSHQAHARAWLLLCGALAVHILDEGLNGFLEFYNPAVSALREWVPLFALPTFSFGTWLAGLIVAVGGLTALTPLVRRGAQGMTPLSHAFAIIMFANGLLHRLGSLYSGERLAGIYSTPLLLVGSVHLAMRTPVSFPALPHGRQHAKHKETPTS
jgi:hypothetical protein